MKKKHKKIFIYFIIIIFVLSPLALAHSGRTDGSGGHHSSSGYHYHHGYPAHQHTNGICPYSSLYSNTTTNNTSSTNNIDTKSSTNTTTKKSSVNSTNTNSQSNTITLVKTTNSNKTSGIILIIIATIISIRLIYLLVTSFTDYIKRKKEENKSENTCKICNKICLPEELINGICLECLGKSKKNRSK